MNEIELFTIGHSNHAIDQFIHRKEGIADSPNFGIKEEAFRNDADHMLGDEFRHGADRLLEIAKNMRMAMMCAESSFHQCHRKLLSDFLLAGGVRSPAHSC